MKKTFLVSLCALFFGVLALNAASLDAKKAKISFGAFKTIDKALVKGSFDDIKLQFGKDNSSIKGVLEGATAVIDTAKINLGDDVKNENLTNFFFAYFKKDKDAKSLIKVKFENVIEGKDKGTILANITMNGVDRRVPLQYNIKDGKLSAIGTIDLLDFSLDNAYKKLIEGCEELHEGVTWTQVELYFEAPIK
ncbi:YceI family protein [Helicobacter sp. MIT 99-5507]|uniref:YceI family protein n=1 Tax=Helicobacter sp. MIT 99-5507 TaxID=152489 RepID=UPI000E1E6FD4|nr:YceI family protein [Helicobacter sp. MIT 99-5507]RDU58353.1 polyisoprenoid-binding protein [Helicobacter sp. MIT 99-5507]